MHDQTDIRVGSLIRFVPICNSTFQAKGVTLMNEKSHLAFRILFAEWSEANPARLQKATLAALSHAFHFFRGLEDHPYDEIPDKMIDIFIEKYKCASTSKNMRFLIESLDQYVRKSGCPDFSRAPFTDGHAVWLVNHIREIVSVQELRDRVDNITGEHLLIETLAAKHLVSIYGKHTNGSVNISRKSVLLLEPYFKMPLSEVSPDVLDELVREAPDWVRPTLRCSVRAIRALDVEFSPQQQACTDPAPEQDVRPMDDPNNTALPYSLWQSTLSDIHDIWLRDFAASLSQATLQSLNTGWNVLRPFWSQCFREITIDKIQEVLLRASPGVQESAKKIFKKLEDTAYSLDIIDRRRTSMLYTDEVVLKPRIPLTDDDIENLKHHQGEWYVDITLVLYYTGFRAGEFAKLKKRDVNMELLEITGGSKSQYGVNRIIPIHPNIEPIIRRWMQDEPGEYLFAQENGNPFSNRDIEHAVKMATAAYCSQPHIPHECRHTFYTNLHRSGGNSAACVARLAGHNPFPLPVDIRVYANPTPDQLHEAINSLQ